MVSMRQRGFTLIEAMTTISLSAFLMMLAIPFTVAWLDSSRQLQARGDLADAVGRAKALALRNEKSLASDVAAAKIVVTAAGTLEVRNADDAPVWSAAIPRGVVLRKFADENVAYECSAYNSRGWLINAGGACTDTASRLYVKIDGQENLNVELL